MILDPLTQCFWLDFSLSLVFPLFFIVSSFVHPAVCLYASCYVLSSQVLLLKLKIVIKLFALGSSALPATAPALIHVS